MSEMKWSWAFLPYLDPPEGQKESALKAGFIKVVDKSEADKVIAEKDDEITALKIKLKVQTSDVEAARKLNTSYLIDYAEALKRESHHKYKRCLAMWMYLRECYWRCKHHNEQTRADWYNKWMNVFQKLAEQFKEAK